MPISFVHYDLVDGYIDNWLVAGPQSNNITKLEFSNDENFKKTISKIFSTEGSGILEIPVEPSAPNDGKFYIGNFLGKWSYYKCFEDHFIELSNYQSSVVFLRGWSFTQIQVISPCDVKFILTTTGPFDLWLNDEHICRQENFYPTKNNFTLDVSLAKGINKILIQFEEVAQGDYSLVLALRIKEMVIGNTKNIKVLLPTNILDVDQRNKFEKIFNEAYLNQSVYCHDAKIMINWPDNFAKSEDLLLRLQTPSGQIFNETFLHKKNHFALMAHSYQVPEGEYNLLLMPPSSMYYGNNLRIKHRLKLWCLGNNEYSQQFYGTFDDRRLEALIRASKCGDNLYAQIAKMAIDWWSRVDFDVIKNTINELDLTQKNKYLNNYNVLFRNQLGLLGIFYRFSNNASMPEKIRKELKRCILNFNFFYEEFNEGNHIEKFNHKILVHTNEILAGQLFPDLIFKRSSKKGRWHSKKGEELALKWMKTLGTNGCYPWDSDDYFEDYLLALSQLIEFSNNEDVIELATVLMDKLFFQIAVNSFKGIFGTTKGNARLTDIQSGLLSPISSISRLMWGMGIFNHFIQGTVLLACMEKYGLPIVIQNIALDTNKVILNKERHSDHQKKLEVNKITYKTPDYMLCSAQNFQPGKKGEKQHIWQATMSSEAIVFVNHPSCSSDHDSQSPNYWRGNSILPQVVQLNDVLIAIYNIPIDDWMCFTHAYFPANAFDEYQIHKNWVFARKGLGYLALTAFHEINLIQSGPYAYRELRSYGINNTWLCQMGREKIDGNFETFRKNVLENYLNLNKLSVEFSTLRGEFLEYEWNNSLLLNGKLKSVSDFNHFENPYCASELHAEKMEIKFKDKGLILDLG